MSDRTNYPPARPGVRVQVLIWRGSGLTSRLIRWQTRGPWSHAALELFGRVYEARQFRRVQSRLLPVVAHEAHARGDTLCTLDLWITIPQAQQLRSWLTDQLGKKYDWTSVARFVTRRQNRRERAHVWFCSELVFAALQKIGHPLLSNTQPWEVSPSWIPRSLAFIAQPRILIPGAGPWAENQLNAGHLLPPQIDPIGIS